ncbi:MAG: hypothetical protein H6R17_3244 [Proteobacteria bacterium]|nr:hypothetical protein [Pseudomonadota bacterium]
MIYLALRHLHVTCVVLSGAGFLLRGAWMWSGSPMLGRRWVRVVPHLVDTALLASAIALAALSGQYPLAQDWLTAKVVALLAYIVCGTMALKRGRSRAVRCVFFVAALAIFGYIVSVAMTRSPLGVFALFI